MTKEEYIDDLINRYFEASTTETEELRLKAILADPTTRETAAVEEARAVMGYTALERAIAGGRRKSRATIMRPHLLKIAARAAAAVAAIAVTLSYATRREEPRTECRVYAQGRVIESEAEAMAIMHSQLEAIGRAQSDNGATDALRLLDAMITEE